MTANTREPHDLIVVGLGAVGAAALWHAAERGLRVLGIDRYDPPHTLGSTHAETRISRLSVGEGPQYLPIVARAHEIWRDIEARTGQTLFHQCGGVILSTPNGADAERWGDFVSATADVAAQADVPFGRLTTEEARDRFPTVHFNDEESIGYEPTAGLVMAELAVSAQLKLARSAGAEIRVNEQVLTITPDDDGVTVETPDSRFRSTHVIVAAGPWISEFAPQDAAQLKVTRQVVFWFEAEDADAVSIENLPFFMCVGDDIEQYHCIFPASLQSPGQLKMMGEQFSEFTDVASVNRSVSQQEIAHFHARFVAPRISGVSDNCLRAEVCLYTNTPDEHFLIDTDPRSDRITLMSPCSGHGFKHSTALAESVVQTIAGETPAVDLSPFARARFADT